MILARARHPEEESGTLPAVPPSEERWEMDVRVRGGKEVLK
jgi:hypothetical protein